MNRQLKRTIKGWKKEFFAFCEKFNTFYRIVFGIIISMLVVYLARIHFLDPLQKEVVEIRKTLKEEGVPDQVGLPENDDETQKTTIKCENISATNSEIEKRIKDLEQTSRYKLSATGADANAALLSLANMHDLKVYENTRIEDSNKIVEKGNEDKKEEEPVAVTREIYKSNTLYEYELRGTFSSVLKFLENVDKEPFLWSLKGVCIKLVTGNEGQIIMAQENEPLLRLNFVMAVYNYRGL